MAKNELDVHILSRPCSDLLCFFDIVLLFPYMCYMPSFFPNDHDDQKKKTTLISDRIQRTFQVIIGKTSKTTFNNDQPRSGKEKDLW